MFVKEYELQKKIENLKPSMCVKSKRQRGSENEKKVQKVLSFLKFRFSLIEIDFCVAFVCKQCILSGKGVSRKPFFVRNLKIFSVTSPLGNFDFSTKKISEKIPKKNENFRIGKKC